METCVGVWVKHIKKSVLSIRLQLSGDPWLVRPKKPLPKYFLMGQSKHYVFLSHLALAIVTKKYPDYRDQ